MAKNPTISYALAGSRNIPAAKAMLSVIPNQQCQQDIVSGCVPSINKVISTADAMMDVPNAYQCYSDVALTQPTQCYASSSFGDGAYLTLAEHVNGLSTLARMGAAIPQTLILKITNSDNKVIYNWTQPKPVQVIQPDAAYIVDNILDNPNVSYLPGSTKFQHYDGWDISVKTGTTNNEYDALMTAWTTQYAVGSWVGYHTRNIALTAGLSEAVTEPLTRNWIQGALTMLNEKPINYVEPPGIKVLPAFQQTIHIDYGDVEPGPTTDLYPSWYTGPALSGNKTTSQTIDKVSGDVATSCTPSLAKENTYAQSQSEFSIDLFYPVGQTVSSSNANVNVTDNVHSCNDPPLALPSSDIAIDNQVDGSPATQDGSGNYDCNGECAIQVTPSSLPPQNTEGSNNYSRYPINVNLLVNGSSVSSQQITDPSATGTLTFLYTPPTSSVVQVSVQLVDNALYSVTTNDFPVTNISTTGP